MISRPRLMVKVIGQRSRSPGKKRNFSWFYGVFGTHSLLQVNHNFMNVNAQVLRTKFAHAYVHILPMHMRETVYCHDLAGD